MPSGLKATLGTPACPLSVSVSWPVAASQTFTVLSQLPLTIRLPSGLKATLVTRFGVPLERERFLARRRVPDLQRLVIAAADDPLPVRAEGHAATCVLCVEPLERERFLARRRVPDLHRPVTALPETIRLPSGLKATLTTSSVCPLSVSVSWPVAASQTFTVPVRLPLTIRSPSGLKATLRPLGRALERERFLARRRVPDLHRLSALPRRSACRPG